LDKLEGIKFHTLGLRLFMRVKLTGLILRGAMDAGRLLSGQIGKHLDETVIVYLSS
jgi:hypothetical protein